MQWPSEVVLDGPRVAQGSYADVYAVRLTSQPGERFMMKVVSIATPQQLIDASTEISNMESLERVCMAPEMVAMVKHGKLFMPLTTSFIDTRGMRMGIVMPRMDYTILEAQRRYRDSVDMLLKLAVMASINVSSALAILEERGLIHGDLSCGNVFVNVQGDSIGVLVGDFGFTQVAVRGVMPNCLVTTEYRAPEIMIMLINTDKNLPVEPYGHPIDVWSLGMIVFEIVSKQPVFLPRDSNEKMLAFLQKSFSPDSEDSELEKLHGCIPFLLMQFLRGALELDPDKRWTAAYAMQRLSKMV